ncbi:MAG: glycosyltransferase family 4 protein [Bacteroidota bacterium]
MSAKKILIVTYYWPPSGGSGVQRWLKFVKYLQREGWEVMVLTPENPSFTMQDPSLLKDVPDSVEVLRLPIWEPYQLFGFIARLAGKKSVAQTDFITTGKKSLFQRVSSWIRGNLFIPDARIFWVKPASTFLNDLIRSNGIEKVITTGPPHSIHLIGLRLKEKNPHIKWVADFRDPWSEWDLLDTLSLSGWARRRHQKLERKVLQLADRVITIAPYHVRRFEALGDRPVDLITNGFDEDDFKGIQKIRNDHFVIRHIGVVDELRDPRPAMVAIKNLLTANSDLKYKVEFVGQVNAAFREWVAADDVLAPITHFVSYVPHKELLAIYGSTDLQLLVLAHTAIAPGNLPGKFFEYLASRNPILAVGPPDGDASDVLQQTGAGKIFERSDVTGMQQFLERSYEDWNDKTQSTSSGVGLYSRKNLTQQLIKLLEAL